VAFSDGQTRYFDTSLDVVNNAGTGEGKLDLSPLSSSSWYYMYLVPKGSDDTQCVGIASKELPTDGPYNDGVGSTRYSAYRYVGVVWVDSGGDWAVFQHHGPWFQRGELQDSVKIFDDNVYPGGTWHSFSVSNTMAPIYVMRGLYVSMVYEPGTSSYKGVLVHADGDTNYDTVNNYTAPCFAYQGTVANSCNARRWVWFHDDATKIWIRIDNSYNHGSNVGCIMHVEGWYDKYLID
jgi:hypothetical protein